MANSKPLQSEDIILDVNGNKTSNTQQAWNSSIRTKIIAAFTIVAFPCSFEPRLAIQ